MTEVYVFLLSIAFDFDVFAFALSSALSGGCVNAVCSFSWMKGKQKSQLRLPQVKQNNYSQTTIALTHLIKAIYYKIK